MKREKICLGAYNLNVISTTNFKTIRVEVNFRRKIVKEEITFRNLLKSLLISSTKKYCDERKIVIKTEDLYDLKLSSSTRRIGNTSLMGFNMVFLNESYTEKGMIQDSLGFLMEILFNPNVIDGSFDIESFNICKNQMIKSIMSRKDNKAKYSIYRLLSNMGNYPYSYDPYGDLEILNSITPSLLYQYYLSVLQKDLVDIYVVGDVETSIITNYFKENFKICTFKKDKENILLPDIGCSKRIKAREEFDSVQQTKLSIGCRLNKLDFYERKYLLHVYNEILGGGGNSLLFDSVREKNSLAYYVSSIVQPYDGLLIIYSGIDDNNIALALKLIKKAMRDIQKGKLDDQIFNNAISSIVSQLDTSIDNQAGIISNYFAQDILNSDDIEKRKEIFSSVKKEEVITFASKIKIDTVFKLRGEEYEKTNNQKNK